MLQSYDTVGVTVKVKRRLVGYPAQRGLCISKSAAGGQHEEWDLIKSIFCLEYCATVSHYFSIWRDRIK